MSEAAKMPSVSDFEALLNETLPTEDEGFEGRVVKEIGRASCRERV